MGGSRPGAQSGWDYGSGLCAPVYQRWFGDVLLRPDRTLWQLSGIGGQTQAALGGVGVFAVCADEEASSVAEVETDRDSGAVWGMGGDQGATVVHGFEGDDPDIVC